MVRFTDSDYSALKDLVEQTLDNVVSMCFDESISNLEEIQEILYRAEIGNVVPHGWEKIEGGFEG